MPVTTASVAAGSDDAHGLALTNRSTTSAIDLWIGADLKFGLNRFASQYFEGLNLPAGVTINSATMEIVPTYSTGNPWLSLLGVVQRDGIWNADSVTGWSRATAYDFRAKLITTTGGSMGESLTLAQSNVTGGWEHRQNASPGRFERSGQSILTTATGTLGSALVHMKQVGTIGGTNNVWLEVYLANGLHVPFWLVATSDKRNASSINTASLGADETFSFSGAEQKTILSPALYAVVLRSDYTIDGTNYLLPQVRTQFPSGLYVDGMMTLYGTGVHLDDQNYPQEGQLQGLAYQSPAIFWNPPIMTPGVPVTTPNFAQSLQAYVDDPGYPGDGKVLVRGGGAAAAGQERRWAAFEHTTLAAPKITISWDFPTLPLVRTGKKFDMAAKRTVSFDLKRAIDV